MDTSTCTRCDGGGQLANTDTREAWSAWLALPVASQEPIRLGLVRPVPCDRCDGSGQIPVRPSPEQVLALRLGENDSGADTVRGYLVALLATLWRRGEHFSGKSPFGNSDWAHDLYRPLVDAGFMPTPYDESGWYARPGADYSVGDKLIGEAIQALAPPAPPSDELAAWKERCEEARGWRDAASQDAANARAERDALRDQLARVVVLPENHVQRIHHAIYGDPDQHPLSAATRVIAEVESWRQAAETPEPTPEAPGAVVARTPRVWSPGFGQRIPKDRPDLRDCDGDLWKWNNASLFYEHEGVPCYWPHLVNNVGPLTEVLEDAGSAVSEEARPT